MDQFAVFAYTPAGACDATIAIAACRANLIGVLNTEFESNPEHILAELDRLASKTSSPFAIKLNRLSEPLLGAIRGLDEKRLAAVILDANVFAANAAEIAEIRSRGIPVLAETSLAEWPEALSEQCIDGLVLKGNEAGGFVGEDSSFILAQRWRRNTSLPLYVRGGISVHVAAAAAALGIGGVVFDDQLLLMRESPFADALQDELRNLAGNETVAVGDAERGEYFRLLVRPLYQDAKALVAACEGAAESNLKQQVNGRVGLANPHRQLMALGQAVCFAASYRKRYRSMAGLAAAIAEAVERYPRQAAKHALNQQSPLAQSLRVDLLVVQGPMTRVSDTPAYVKAVSQGGALPMLALALMKGEGLKRTLAETEALLAEQPWGIGLLGFAPQALLDEQIAAARIHKPDFAIIAGGRPDQSAQLDALGIPSFLHVPSVDLLGLFISNGARRFILEGRECGGHIGPLSSFVLWSAMVDRLMAELEEQGVAGSEIQLLLAGGIHDALSSAIAQTIVAPLSEKGVQVGVLMGSAYLFTKEIVATGAVVPSFQQTAENCTRTVNLESGPGHASRCAYTDFAGEFFRQRKHHIESSASSSPDVRKVLDDLILGRLRIASKGQVRSTVSGELQGLDARQQQAEGMYMLGQVATIRDQATTIADLHREVTEGAGALLAAGQAKDNNRPPIEDAEPADVAIVGIGCLMPGADSTPDYWNNILDKVDAIREIPRNRWDWRLYYSEDRNERDKIYSKWGGFLNDLPFDPTAYGMPPKSMETIDPMQLMALEVARRTLDDAGYANGGFDRERASVIIGASGGVGDVGLQYGLRAELPRFAGALSDEMAARLPEWSEDTFAGILLNVLAGRIANRLDFGGVNFSVDAACASSLTAVCLAVGELTSGRSDLVLTGGVDTVQGPFGFMCFSKTQALSPRGRCRTFDAESDGIVISEGIAMVALKRLADAERDGDRIYAVIKGITGGSDGKARGLSAPLPAGQLRAMRRAYAQAGYAPASVGLFEAHGTGTVAGDTAELESTTSLVKESGGQAHQAIIGSVKTMIGHTKASAGVAGLVKSALALHHNVLPPHAGVDTPTPPLLEEDSPLYLINEPRPWLASDLPRRAAVSSFGFGGTNFHATLEEYTGDYRPWLKSAAASRLPAELLIFDAPTRDDLQQQLTKLQAALSCEHDYELRDIAFSLCRSSSGSAAERLAIVARNFDELQVQLKAALDWLSGAKPMLPPGISHGTPATAAGKLAVLFSGQGSQYTDMLRELAVYFGDCRDTLSQADTILADAFGKRFGAESRLSHFIYPRACYSDSDRLAADKSLTRTDVAQPALGAVEVALWRLIQGMGLQADMAAGHSYGEFVALYAAGVFDFETLLSLSEARGRYIVDAAKQAGEELGTMAAVKAARQTVEAAIRDIPDLVVANHNSPTQSIISGSVADVERAVASLEAAGLHVNQLHVAAAFHSRFVAPAQHDFAALIGQMDWSPAQLPVYSNSTGARHDADPEALKLSMSEHLTNPVEFVREIESMYDDGARIFVEIGPRAVLTRLTGQILADREHVAIAMDGMGGGVPGLLDGIGQLCCAGINLEVMQLFAGRDAVQCDIGDLVAKPRRAPLSKHAWLINGSGVRRAAESVRQVGVLAGEVSSSNDNEQESEHRAPPEPVKNPRPMASKQQANFRIKPTIKLEDHMPERKRGPSPHSDGVMADYFALMQEFLATQERVMQAYLGDSRSQGPRRQRSLRPGGNADSLPQQAPQQIALGATTHEDSGPNGRSVNGVRDDSTGNDVEVPLVTSHHDVNGHSEPVNGNQAAAAAPIPSIGRQDSPVNGDVVRGNGSNGNTVPSTVDGNANTKGNGTDSETLTVEQITDLLYELVADKTGYPRDMVGMDQNLEADLGIDSIKRVEIVGALLQKLPDSYMKALGGDQSSLNTQATLNGIIHALDEIKLEGVPDPFDHAGAGSVASEYGHLPRYAMEAAEESIPSDARRELEHGEFIITRDTLGVADRLAVLLESRGRKYRLVDSATLADPATLERWIDSTRIAVGELAGIVNLVPISSQWLDSDSAVDAWRTQLQVNEKAFFSLFTSLSGWLNERAHILSASGLGGRFMRSMSSPAHAALSVQGGQPGLLKSLHEELPRLRVRAMDIDPDQPINDIADAILAELEMVGGRIEVGYPNGIRTIFKSVPVGDSPGDAADSAIEPAVILITGGAKGVTAEMARELARPDSTLIIVGRSPLPRDEPADQAACADAESLRQHFIGQVRSGAAQLKPAQIQQRIDGILANRELLANIADLQERGATVEYCTADVTDEAGMRQLVAEQTNKFGPIDTCIHGAGIVEDKLLSDKTSESWSRVVDTKVLGLMILQKVLDHEQLKFLVVMSSVAGRYGNTGQADYATANELMNRLCGQLHSLWDSKVTVKALCWGPWAATQFGTGMVTPAIEAKFAARGVTLVESDTGRRLFRSELIAGPASRVEIICGDGPWEAHEAASGEIQMDAGNAADGKSNEQAPLLSNANLMSDPKGEHTIRFDIDQTHAYIQEHRLDDSPVLPVAVALEMIAEGAHLLWPDWTITAVADCALLKGVVLGGEQQSLSMVIDTPAYGSASGFSVNVRIQSDQESGVPLMHFRAVLELGQLLPKSEQRQILTLETDRQISVEQAYGQWLFHGPRLQVIEAIHQFADGGANATVRSTTPGDLLTNTGVNSSWQFDPALVDAAAQMGVLWAREFRGETALPTKFGRVTRFVKELPKRMTMSFERIVNDEPHTLLANVYFTDTTGQLVMLIEDMNCISSAALNRVGGHVVPTQQLSA